MKSIGWRDFPLPLIQINPPPERESNKLISEIYKNEIYTNSGPIQRRASKLLGVHLGDQYSGYLATSNTAALIACLLALDVRGRHVVVSNFTFAATMHAIIMAGGIPVLCDVDEETLILDILSLKEIFSSKQFDIRAVVPTRVFGYVSDLSLLIELCDSKQVPVVVDAAASYPGIANSWNFDRLPKYEVFSLHATKVFGIGEGGLIVGGPSAIEKVSQIANFGIMGGSPETFSDGLNAKADEYTAARAIVRFSHYYRDVDARQQFCQLYKNWAKNFDEISILKDDERTNYAYFPVIFKSENLLNSFKMEIEKFLITRRYYYPTLKSGYGGTAKLEFPVDLAVSESTSRRILCLPVYVKYENSLTKKLSLKLFEIMSSIL